MIEMEEVLPLDVFLSTANIKISTTISVCNSICWIINCLQDEGLRHGDMALRNLWIDRNNDEVGLLDFGLCERYDAENQLYRDVDLLLLDIRRKILHPDALTPVPESVLRTMLKNLSYSHPSK